MKPRFLLMGFALVCGIYLLVGATPNLLGLLTDSEYFVPAGSTVFTFRPTVMNPGSGDWWIYGEDSHYYYYFEDGIKVSKQTADMCQGFSRSDVTTWCLSQ
jgi:hypothetical protein